MNKTNGILYYDGECSLCNRWVQWTISRDKKGVLSYAPLQDHAAFAHVDSVVLQIGDRYYFKSDAVIKLLTLIGGGWQWARVAKIIPAFLRNSIYDFVAKRRKKWSHPQPDCKIPNLGTPIHHHNYKDR